MRKRSCILAAAFFFASTASAATNGGEAAERAAADLRESVKRAARLEREILADREALASRIEGLEATKATLEASITDMERTIAKQKFERTQLTEKTADRAVSLKNLSGTVSAASHDLESLMRQSALAALDPTRMPRVAGFFDPVQLLGPGDLFALAELYTDEIAFSERVSLREGPYTDRNGEVRTADVLTVGKFTALYGQDEETGFLTFTPQTGDLSALSVLPSRGVQRRVQSYLAGREETVPIDLSGGSVLRQAAEAEGSTERVRHGGFVLVAFLLAGIGALVHRKRSVARAADGAAAAPPTPYRIRWGIWALKHESQARRASMAFIYALGLVAYLWGTKSVSQSTSPQVQLSVVSLVSLPPPGIAGQRRAEQVDQLREIEISKNITETPAEEADFVPDLVDASFSGPLSSSMDIDIAVDLSNLASRDMATEAGLAFEAYELDQPPQPVFKVPPPYPFGARERGVEGAVQVRMLVEPDGSVAKVLIVDARPQGLFEDTVMKSLAQWRFSPGKIEGKTVTAWVVTTIHFDLN